MKELNRNIEEAKTKKKGRVIAAVIHVVFLGLLAFPFLQMSSPEAGNDIIMVMDFSSGSSMAGATAAAKPTVTPKPVEKPKPVMTSTIPEPVEVKETPPIKEEVVEPVESETEDNAAEELPDNTTAKGTGAEGAGDAKEGSAANGNGRGFIEGDGVLSRAVVKYGKTKELAHVNGKLVLKICINRRGIVNHAEWDKEQSTIKDSDIAREALKNVMDYRFEKDNNAPKKECGRLTYIFNVE